LEPSIVHFLCSQLSSDDHPHYYYQDSDNLHGGCQVFEEGFLGFLENIHLGKSAVAVVGRSLNHYIIGIAYTNGKQK
jgi:hypothetical protein